MKPSKLRSSYDTINDLLQDFCIKNNVKWYIDILIDYANKEEVIDVTELGIYQGISTSAFLTTNIKKLKSYDITLSLMPVQLFKQLNKKIDWTVDVKNSIKDKIDNTDLLFIDTVHTYEHVQKELELHHVSVSKFIIIHDTEYPIKKTKKKVSDAVLEFANTFSSWKIVLHNTNETGIMILEKKYG